MLTRMHCFEHSELSDVISFLTLEMDKLKKEGQLFLHKHIPLKAQIAWSESQIFLQTSISAERSQYVMPVLLC